MRIAWRWVLPVVPLLLVAAVAVKSYWLLHREPMPGFYAHMERFDCVLLWGSRDAYQDYQHAQMAMSFDCWNRPLTNTAVLLNLPAFILAALSAQGMLELADVPMALTFYTVFFSVGFLYWYAIGDWIERRRRLRTELMSTTRDPSLRSG